MTKELMVKYKNDMNKLSFKGFTKNDMNLFLAICAAVKEKGNSEITLSFEYLRRISGYTATAIDVFVKDLRKMSKDVLSVNCEIITENKIDMFNLFSRFTIDRNEQILTVKINDEFLWLLNEFTDQCKGYTAFELQEFISLESRYSKNLYRLLKQWKSTGEYMCSVEDFREKLDVPNSYANKRLVDKVIRPAIQELSERHCFENLNFTTIHAPRRGRPVIAYVFTYAPNKQKKTSKICNDTQENKSAGNKSTRSKKLDTFRGKERHRSKEFYEQLEMELLNR